MITSVYRAAVKKFISGEHTLHDQSEMAHDYYNNLIALKLRKRAEYRRIRSEHFPSLAEVEEKLAELNEEIGKGRPSPEQREQRKALAAKQKVLRAEFADKMRDASAAYDARTNNCPVSLVQDIQKLGRDIELAKRSNDSELAKKLKATVDALRKKKKDGAPQTAAKGGRNKEVFIEMYDELEWPDVWKQLKKLDIDAHAEARQIRADSGLTHGTYIAIENAVAQAEETSLLDPRFRPWQRGNTCDWRKVGMQLQGGLDVPLLRRDKGKIRFLRVWDQARGEHHTNGHAPSKRKKQRAEVVLELGKGLPPIQFEIMMWRPLPEDAKITWVYLVSDLRGGWELQFTLNTPKRLVERKAGRGTVKIESVGSRNADGRVVVARVDGDEYLLPTQIEDKLVGAEGIRSASDVHFDGIVRSVQNWLAREGAEPWMLEEDKKGHTLISNMGKWSGHWRMHRLAKRWCGDPVEDGMFSTLRMYKDHWHVWLKERQTAGFDLYGTEEEAIAWATKRGIENPIRWHLFTWTRKDIHLQKFEDGRRQSAMRARKNAYRTLAARLSETFEFASLANVLLAEKASEEKRKKGEPRDPHNPRVLASCYEFEDAIKLAFGRERWSGAKKAPVTRKAPKSLKMDSPVLPSREDAAE